MRHYTRFLLCFLVLGVFLSFSYAQETPEKAKQLTEIDLITDKAKASTVRLVGFSKRGADLGLGGGTGFFVAPDKIATNFHVAVGVSGLMTAKLSHKETVWLVEGVVAFDVAYDIAILKVTGEGTPLSLGDSDTLQIGEPVFLAGFPDPEGRYKVTEGVVEKIRKNDKQFRTTVETYPGNSGSPVLNSKGEIIGIHYGHDPGNSPVNVIKALLAGATATESFTQWHKRNEIRAHTYFGQGKQKYYDSDPEGALENFNKAIELTPNDAEIYKFRAKAKVRLEDYPAAIEDYNQVIELNPDDASAYKERAEAKRKLGDHTGAIEDYNQATQLDPKDPFTYRASADAKRKSGDYTGAIEDYTHAITLNPEDAEAYKNRGKARAKLGDDAEAIEDYSQALKLNPNYVFTYDDRADIKQKLGDYTGAIEDYNQVIAKLKDGSFTYTYQIKHGSTTVTTTPSDSYIYYVYNNRGRAKRALGDHTGAIEDFTQAIKLKPDDAYGYNNRGWAKQEQGDHTGAIEDFTQAIKLNPNDPNAYQLRGHSKKALGQEEAAQIDFQKAKELESAQVRKIE